MESQNGTAEQKAFVDLAVASGWSAAIFIGLITAGLGVVVLVWPGETLAVLSVLFGIQLLLFGLFRLISAFSGKTLVSPLLMGIIGIIGMVVGVAVLRHPFETVAVLATLLGIVWIVGGAVDVIASISDSELPNRGFTAIGGILSGIAGIIVVSWPEPTAKVIAWVGGIYLVAIGIMFIIAAFQMRKIANATA